MLLERRAKIMARKKIVFVIVEGPSDDAALGVILNRLFDQNFVYVEIVHGDITADWSIQPNKINQKISSMLRKYADSHHFKRKDFQEIIHIVDTDGAFVPDSAVVKNEQARKPIYTLTTIETARPELICQRNVHKQCQLNSLINLHNVWGYIPYKVYYMSANLDHVLYNKLNSSDLAKEEDAFFFAQRYACDLTGFLHFMSASSFAEVSGYTESWDFIKTDLHSLERHSNLGLCLARFME